MKIRTSRRPLLSSAGSFLTIAMLSALPARAALIASDQFTDTESTLAGNTGGTGWSAAWTGSGQTVVATSLQYTDSNGAILPTAGGAVNFGGNNTESFRVLTAGLGTDGTTIYMSFLAQITSGDYAGIALFNGTNEVFFAGKPFGATNFGYEKGGGGDRVTAANSPVTSLSLLVYKIEFGAGTTLGNERVSLFVNPTLGTEPTTISVSNNFPTFAFDRIRISSGLNAVTGQVDEFRMGTTYLDVAPVPEPSAALLSALGVFGLAVRRRR